MLIARKMMRRRRISYAKEAYYILCIAGSLFIAAFTVWGPRGFLEMRKAQRELEIHRSRIEAIREANRESAWRIQGLLSDQDAQEKVARELGYAREREIIQHLPPEAPPPKAK